MNGGAHSSGFRRSAVVTSESGRPARQRPWVTQPVPVREAFWTVWREPRQTVLRVARSDAAGFVILVAWLSGVLHVLQNAALRASLKPNWGPFVVLLAVFMGPILGFVYFDVGGALVTRTARMLGGLGSVSETRVALACGSIAELVALPLWLAVLAFYGAELFTETRGALPPALLAFAAFQVALLFWAWRLRFSCLAEVHGFSIGRAFASIALAWLGFVALLVTAVVIGMKLDGK
jgi:hypothetical protein